MHLITPEGRWTAPPGQFAARIRPSDLPGVLSKRLRVDFGVRATLVEDGEILGELRPGTYTLDSLAARFSLEPRRETAVVVLREEAIPIELAQTDLRTQDGQAVRVATRVSVQADDVTLFLENVLGARDRLALDELRSLLAPALVEEIQGAVGRMPLDELMQPDAVRRLTAELAKGGETLRHHGFRLGPVLALSVSQVPQPAEPVAVMNSTAENQPTAEPASRLRKSGRRTICGSDTGRSALALGTAPACAHAEGTMETCPATNILVNSLGMRLASIPSGRFLMGSPPDEPDRSGVEDQHVVEISAAFHLGVFPVTQQEYRSILGTDPSCFAQSEASEAGTEAGACLHAAGTERDSPSPSSPRRGLPVERVSWDDACEFCRRLSELPAEKAAGRLYRLPTEAEWEYACRAHTTSAFAIGQRLSPADANYDARPPHGDEGTPGFRGSTTPVGSYRANAWGLCDMHGNVWEWCADWFAPDYYRQSPSCDPQGAPAGFARVLRGGSWRSRPGQCRSASRWSATPTQRHDSIGFRVACVYTLGP